MAVRIISTSELRRRLRAVLQDLNSTGEPYFLTQHARPRAVLIPIEEYNRLVERSKGARLGIVQDPEIAGGEPRIQGTRITVRHIVERVKGGESEEQILQALPHLTAAQLHEALAYFHQHQGEIERLIEEARPGRVLSLHGLRAERLDSEVYRLGPSR